jgi:hypothetical protein
MILKKINLEISSDSLRWRCTKCDRPIESLDGKSKQRRKEERGRERKRVEEDVSLLPRLLGWFLPYF